MLILLIVNQVLLYSVTPPSSDGQPTRYLIYWFMFLISSIGTNLIVLHLGYNANKSEFAISKLSKIYFYLVCTGVLGIVFAIIAFKAFSSVDIWLLFFPISHNNFPFAASVLIWYVFGYQISNFFSHLSLAINKAIFFFLTWFAIIMPFLFGKTLWGINSGNSFIWVGILFIYGILIRRIDIKKIIKPKYEYLIALFIIILLPVLLKVSTITQAAANLQSRLYSNYSLPLFFLSLILFNIFEKQFSFKKIGKLTPSINWFILVSYFVTQLPIINYHLSKDFHIEYSSSSKIWMLNLIVIIISISISIVIITLLIDRIARFSKISVMIQE